MSRICPTCNTVYPEEARFCGRCATQLEESVQGTGWLSSDTLLQGRYRILRRIAVGGMGAVYEAIDQRVVGKRWAIKEMSNAALGSTQELEAQEAFRREAEILAHLRHANLPTVADFFSERGKHYLVMEYIQGETLEAMLRAQGVIPESRVLQWAWQLCDALSYLHSQHPPIIFRDLKPANIMITRDERVKLIDFGIARHFHPDKAGDTIALGTPGYAAPEQYGKNQSDVRTDIYGFGATLHHLLSGQDPSMRPFHFTPLHELNPDVSERTAEVIDRAVQRNPAARFPSIETMRSALPVTTGDLGKRKTGQGRGRKLFLAGVSLLSIVLVLVLIIRFVWPTVTQAEEDEIPQPPVVIIATTIESELPLTAPTFTPVPPTSTVTPQPENTPVPSPTSQPATPTTPPPTETPVLPTATPSPPPLSQGAELIGYSFEGQPIELFRFGNGPRAVVLIGGMHYGFAPSSVLITNQSVAHFSVNSDEIPEEVSLYIIPNMNPDSVYDPGYRPGRTNARGVDLNRNWDCNWRSDAQWDNQPIGGGTTPFSEPETQAVREFLLELRPEAVIFFEARAADGMVTPGNCNGVYSGSDALMRTYYTNSGYSWYDGVPVTGDASNWAAREGMASISVILRSWTELPDAEWQRNLRALRAVLNNYQ